MQTHPLSNYRDDQPYIPPTRPYELSHLAADLVILARYLLKPGGRLVFFLPTVTEEYEEVDVSTMVCEGMDVIANSLQDFGSWGRRASRDFPFCTLWRINFIWIVGDNQENYVSNVSTPDVRYHFKEGYGTCSCAQGFPREVLPGVQAAERRIT